ncbi:hypothetical protein ACLOJK_008475 [Asimina triloba]
MSNLDELCYLSVQVHCRSTDFGAPSSPNEPPWNPPLLMGFKACKSDPSSPAQASASSPNRGRSHPASRIAAPKSHQPSHPTSLSSSVRQQPTASSRRRANLGSHGRARRRRPIQRSAVSQDPDLGRNRTPPDQHQPNPSASGSSTHLEQTHDPAPSQAGPHQQSKPPSGHDLVFHKAAMEPTLRSSSSKFQTRGTPHQRRDRTFFISMDRLPQIGSKCTHSEVDFFGQE